MGKELKDSRPSPLFSWEHCACLPLARPRGSPGAQGRVGKSGEGTHRTDRHPASTDVRGPEAQEEEQQVRGIEVGQAAK